MSIWRNPWCWCGLGLTVVVMIMSITLIALSIQVVEPTEYGVTYDRLWKNLGDTYDQGRYSIRQTSVFIRFNNTYQPIDYTLTGSGIELTCMSQDGMWVVIDVVSQYKVIRSGLIPLLEEYDQLLDRFVKTMAASTFINVCSYFEIETGFLQNRQNISSTMLLEFQKKIQEIGLPIDTQFAELRNYRYNLTYAEAVTDKQVAQQQIELLLSQRPVLVTNAQTQLVYAEQQSLINLQQADITASAILASYQSNADAKYQQWVQYTNGFATTLSKLNMNASTFVQTYLQSYLLSDDTNKNPLYVRLN